MKSRERVLAALNHVAPDRTPIDLGSSNVTSVHLYTYKKLLAHFGLRDDVPRIIEYASQLVLPCEELLRVLKIDTRGVFLSPPRRDVARFLGEDAYIDAWGISWRRPQNGYYFDVERSPLEQAETLDEVRAYKFPTIDELASSEGVAEEALRIRRNTEYALVGSFGSSIFMRAQQIRGYSRLLEDMLLEEEISDYLLEHILRLRIGLADLLLDACADELDIVEMADDVAGQESLLISPAVYRRMIKPYTRALIAHIKSRTNAKILYHSCGNIEPLIEDLIEIGVDVLNPIQVSAGGMSDLQGLKSRYGDRLCFWGAIDSQKLLPNASAEEVAFATRRTTAILGQGGGYVLCASHNLQNDVPVDNILFMYRAAVSP